MNKHENVFIQTINYSQSWLLCLYLMDETPLPCGINTCIHTSCDWLCILFHTNQISYEYNMDISDHASRNLVAVNLSCVAPIQY